MHPSALDIRAIQLLAPLQTHPLLVDAVDALSTSSLPTVVFAIPLFLIWRRSEPDSRAAVQHLLFTVLLATCMGALASLCLQRVVRWPPPAVASATANVYAMQFRYNENPNSFPSDSTMLFSTVAFGTAAWSRSAGIGLLAWLLLFVAPIRIFVGGHYPTDIAVGLLIGVVSFLLSRYITRGSRIVASLAASSSPFVATALFVWLFEIGKGYGDVRQVANILWHLRRHL